MERPRLMFFNRDKKRLDWLEKHKVCFDWDLGNGWSTGWSSYSFLNPRKDLRNKIDMAMALEKPNTPEDYKDFYV